MLLRGRISTLFVVIALLLGATSSHEARAQFGPGEYITYSQDSWGAAQGSNVATVLLLGAFDLVYPLGGVEVGINGPSGYSMVFLSPGSVMDYLPASGGPGSLNSDLVEPTSTNAGLFGGGVLALQLDVDFADAGATGGTSEVAFGDLHLFGLTTTPAYNAMTVRQFLAAMNSAIGGGPISYDFDSMAALTNELTLAFESGMPSGFAQDHLAVPEPRFGFSLASGVVLLAFLDRHSRRNLSQSIRLAPRARRSHPKSEAPRGLNPEIRT